MYLKSLELHGFKSFAYQTTLTFLPLAEDKYSITAIVGPNGSGKSNIADAILWVMGEQSMRTLRGKKSEDIIFSGSAAKEKLGLSSVSMTLDNSDSRVPLEYEAVVITRRLYRSGESEYLVNGHPVRLFDLQVLLAQAQFGQGSYSVIGQGMIDQLILQTASERKEFFDEAAGIKEFQIKRHQAALKLARTRENLIAAELLLNEVVPRLRSLSRQVKKLEERQAVEKALREWQEQYYVTLWQGHETQLQDLRPKLDRLNQEYTKEEGELSAMQKESIALAHEKSGQTLFGELQREFQVLLREKTNLERERAVLVGRLQSEYSAAGHHNVGWLMEKIESLKERESSLSKEVETANEQYNAAAEEVALQQIKLEKFTADRSKLRTALAEREHKLVRLKSEQSTLQSSEFTATQMVLAHREQLGIIYGAVAELGEVEEKYQLAMDVAAGNHLSSLVVHDDQVAERCIQFLRQEQVGVATFLPLNKIQLRFLAADIKRILREPGVHGLAQDLIRYDDKFEKVFSYIFGNTVIVEDIDAARRIGIGRIRMVTLAGDVMEMSGSMKGGYRARRRLGLSFSHHHTPYRLSGELEKYETELAEVRKHLEHLEIELARSEAELRGSITEAERRRSELEVVRDQKERFAHELTDLQQELRLQTVSKEGYNSIMQEIALAKGETEVKIASLENEFLAKQKAIESLHRAEDEKKQRLVALQEAMQSVQEKLNQLSAGRNQLDIEVAKLETKQEDLQIEIYQELHLSIESVIKRGVSLLEASAVEPVFQEIQKLKYKLSLIGGLDDEVFGEYRDTKERHDLLVRQLADLKKAWSDLEGLIAELDEIMKKKRAQAFKDIRREFARYFQMLFDGGKADLIEVHGEEIDREQGSVSEEKDLAIKRRKTEKVLVGIDLIANPPGKKITHLPALSGGERTLTSLALVCAILKTNPSPFVVLDEVEAALDEANTIRFTQILHELSYFSQFIIITHNRATMHAADVLYGVTMGSDGISKLWSVKLEEALVKQ